MNLIGESAIRARDFAGFVPASRGAHCRPLHPRLASFFSLERKTLPTHHSVVDLGWWIALRSPETADMPATAVVGSCPPWDRDAPDPH
jgi:hypothetical protein